MYPNITLWSRLRCNGWIVRYSSICEARLFLCTPAFWPGSFSPATFSASLLSALAATSIRASLSPFLGSLLVFCVSCINFDTAVWAIWGPNALSYLCHRGGPVAVGAQGGSAVFRCEPISCREVLHLLDGHHFLDVFVMFVVQCDVALAVLFCQTSCCWPWRRGSWSTRTGLSAPFSGSQEPSGLVVVD